MLAALLEFIQRHLPVALAGLFSLSTLAIMARFVRNHFVRSMAVKIEAHFSRPPLNVAEIYEATNRRQAWHHGCSGADCLRRHAIVNRLHAFAVPEAFMLLQREGKVVFHAGLYYLKGTEPQGAS